MSEYTDLFRFVITDTIDLIVKIGSGFLKVTVVLLAIILPFAVLITFFVLLFALIYQLIELLGSIGRKKKPEPKIIKLNGFPGAPQTPYQVEESVQTDKKHYTHTNSKGVKYHLNKKNVLLRGGKSQMIYYFSKDLRPEACELPDGFTVNENPRNGFLTIRRPL